MTRRELTVSLAALFGWPRLALAQRNEKQDVPRIGGVSMIRVIANPSDFDGRQMRFCLADFRRMTDSAFDPQLFHHFQKPLHRAGRFDPYQNRTRQCGESQQPGNWESDSGSCCETRSITKSSVVADRRGRKAVVSVRGCLISTVVLQCSDRIK